MKLKKIAAVFLAVMTLGLSACGAPAISTSHETTVEGVDPNATRVTAPGAENEDTTTASAGTTKASESTTPSTTGQTPENDPSTSGESRIHFLAAGDNIIHTNVYTDAKNRAKDGEKYDFIDMYADIADFVAAADLAFVNQETPLGGDELGISGYPNFNGPQDAGRALVDLGFDLVNIATNHMLDKKEKGLQGGIDFWNSEPVTLLGGYKDKEDYENIRVVEKNGIKIAFLSYTYGTNGMTLPASSKLYIPLIDQNEIVSMIGKAKKLADTVFVIMHWGTDSSFIVTNEQTTLAKAMAAAGADAIIGMHSHTVQPVEWIQNTDGSRTLVIYSLGNLISTMYENFTMVGGIMTFDIVKSDSGEITIEKPIMNPVVTHYDADRLNLQVYLLKDYTEELAAKHGTVYYSKDKRFSLAIAKGYVTSVVDDEFLPDFMKSGKD